ncbi:MAG: PAS domain-containing protein, partial [Candidatus Omnitrophica bacterium]|nr:PAS domain-containing protein [Candidatus Omnitrophota bacterium]
EAEKKLNQVHANTKVILEKAQVGVVVIGRDKKIIWANERTRKMAGVENIDDLIGKSCGEYLCPAAQDKCPFLDLKKRVDNSERILRRKDGREIPIIKTVNEINFDNKDVLLETFIDISERKKVETSLRNNLDDLEQFRKVTVDRENRMIELKKEVNRLCKEIGRTEKYDLSFLNE